MTLTEALENDPDYAKAVKSHPQVARVYRALANRLDLVPTTVNDRAEFMRLAGQIDELKSWLADKESPPTEEEVGQTFIEHMNAKWAWLLARQFARSPANPTSPGTTL